MKACFARKRTLWLPTWQGTVIIAFIFIILVFLFVSQIHSFLAKSERVNTEILVVEGWIPDYALMAAVREFNKGGYGYLCTTGGPLNHGSHLARFDDWATLSASTLEALGIPQRALVVAPAPSARRHRTYRSAVALKNRLAGEGISAPAFNVLTLAPHARRTRLVYEAVFGNEVEVGIISIASKEYDPDRWWASSGGVKTVLTETIGWFVERVISPRVEDNHDLTSE